MTDNERFLHFLNHGKINKSPYESPKEKVIVINRRDDPIKKVISKNYNYSFNKENGFFCRWGKSKDSKDDPIMAPAPEILDYEISTKCDFGCAFCYKSNLKAGKTVDIETFKDNLDKIVSINPILTQIAFGVGSLNNIPWLRDILSYTRSKDIVPNITIASHELNIYKYGRNNENNDQIQAIKEYCGACSVSNYDIEDTLNCVEMLKFNSKIVQVNIHQLLSKETYQECLDLLQEINQLTNESKKPNAVVFLWVKPKGRAVNKFHPVTQSQLNTLIDYTLDHNIGFGMDSCSAPFCMKHPKMEQFKDHVEFCESVLFSAYLDVNGNFSPCSFTTNESETINIKSINTLQDLWYSTVYKDFRERLLNNCRNCPSFNLSGD